MTDGWMHSVGMCKICDFSREKAEERRRMQGVEKGDTVRVEFEAEYRGFPLSGDDKLMLKVDTPDGKKEIWVPGGAKVTLVKKYEPPLPDEPLVGSVVEFPDGAVYARWSPTAGPNSSYGWIGLNGSNNMTCNWAAIVKKHGRSWTSWGKKPAMPKWLTEVPF